MNIRFAKKLDSDHMSKVKISWTRGMILYELSKGQHASEHALMGYDTVSASDGAGINAFGGYFMLGLFGIACIGAAAYAFLHGPRELREVVSTKMHTGMERASEAVHSGKEMASSAAAKGKKLASSLPEQLPFEVPRVFTKSRANYNGYKDVEGESVSMTQPLSTRIGKHGKGYGSISSGDAGQQPEGAEGEITIAKNKFSFGTLFPQLQEAGSKLMRRSSSDTALSRLMPGKENASVAAQETEEEGACMVCAGRRKMGVEGLCGLCSQREDSKC